MPPLAELQHHFAQAVLSGEVPTGLLAGTISPAEALSIHRDTIMDALVNALRLSYPTVETLVGEEFFDWTCRIFAEANLPKTASLAIYGEAFADFLAGFAPAADLPYLADVARLDRAVETALRAPTPQRRFVIDVAVSIVLPQSLTVLPLMYPADEIRAGIKDDAIMAKIVIEPAQRFILVWRKGFDAAVRRVSVPAGRFLISLLAGEGAEAAFHAASACEPEAVVLSAIQAELFAAPFCTVISTLEELRP